MSALKIAPTILTSIREPKDSTANLGDAGQRSPTQESLNPLCIP